ncbi:MAG: efflux RND transporter periplasmic adaptor subunit [Bacteroidota bacterium]|nr:efflux RND transporter periplasmic adaptor subunit [Bacteroidota bacterium]
MRRVYLYHKNILLFSGILALFTLLSCQSSHSYLEMTVMEGPFRQSFTETGDLAAIKSTAVPMPRVHYQYGYEFKIMELMDNGSYVSKGDTIAKLDDSSIQKFIISMQEALETEEAASNKQKIESQNALQDLNAHLRSEQATYNLKKLELERSEFDTEQKRKLKKLEFDQATIRINKTKRQLKEKPIMNEYDRIIQQIKVMQKESELAGAFKALGNMVVTSPEEGLFQVGSSMFHYPPQDLKVGDQVYQGGLIARIPDVSKMRVNTFVNETDFTKIKVGSKVLVRLDALPDVNFHGIITYISRTCIKKDKKKVFKVKVEVMESDLRLKPGMTVSCEYICYESEKEIFAPNNCVLKENGQAFVFLHNGSNPEKLKIEARHSNSHHTVISGDIRPGQKLIPFEEVLTKASELCN